MIILLLLIHRISFVLLLILMRRRRVLAICFALLDFDYHQVELRYLYRLIRRSLDLYELLFAGEVELLLRLLHQIIVFLFKLAGLLSELLRLLQKVQEGALTVIAILQLYFELTCHLLVHFVMIVQVVEIGDELLIIVYRHLLFHLFHVFNFLFVICYLLCHFVEYFVAILVALFYVQVAAQEFL